MAFLPPDLRELFLPLVEGIHQNPPWGTFMRNLVARTHAQRALLVIALAGASPGEAPTAVQFAAPGAAGQPSLDFDRLVSIGLQHYRQLRPERVYSLEELYDFGHPEQLARQQEELRAMGVRFGRWLRLSAGAADAWVVLVREREDFSSAAVATLAAIAPLLGSALRARVQLGWEQLQAALAQDTLGRLGIGQVALDAEGRIMAADPNAEAMLAIVEDPTGKPGRRLQSLPETARRIEQACAAIAQGEEEYIATIPLDPLGERFLQLRRADLDLPPPCARPAVIGMVRQPGQIDPRRAVAAIREVHGLSAREAGLAYRMMLGERIVEAGAHLRLTPETARNYSKRVYAKTRTSGQADLVRVLMQGLAPLA